MENIVIYCIQNNINGNIYVGSTIDYNRRIKSHLNQLNQNKHCNIHLQRAWNMYGKENFDIFILRNSNKEMLLSDEQWCLDIIKPEYNICKIAGNTLGLKWDEERRIKQMKYISNRSELHNKNLSISMKNNLELIKISSDRCKLMCENNKRKIEVLDLNENVLFTFNSILETANYFKTNKSNVQARACGRIKGPFNLEYKFRYKNN